MLRIVAIAAGGAAGSLLRYWMSTGVYAILGRGFPYGTLVVNVVGSLLMGVCFVMFMERMVSSPEWRAAVLIGLLGAFTTFSTFSMETLNLLEGGAYFRAAANVVLSVVLCLAATWVGVVVGRQI
jgi:CrcB protein